MENKKCPRRQPGAMCNSASLECTTSAMMLAHKVAKSARRETLNRANRLASSWMSGGMSSEQFNAHGERCLEVLDDTIEKLALSRGIIEKSIKNNALHGAARESANKTLAEFANLLYEAHAEVEAE
jgi:hypothetical protein